MFWPITVFFKNFNLFMTLATSPRCRLWRKTGSRWIAFISVFAIYPTFFACQCAPACTRNLYIQTVFIAFCIIATLRKMSLVGYCICILKYHVVEIIWYFHAIQLTSCDLVQCSKTCWEIKIWIIQTETLWIIDLHLSYQCFFSSLGTAQTLDSTALYINACAWLTHNVSGC